MTKHAMAPPINDEVQENKLIALAFRQAQEQLEKGTASSQIVTHFLKLGSTRGEIELKKIELENRLLEERIASEQSGQRLHEMVGEVLVALKSYSYAPPGDSHADLFRT